RCVALLLLLIIALGPGFFLEGAAGVFVERLPTKLGTAIADVNGLGGAALDDYRRDTVEFGHVSGFLEPISVGAEGDEQTRRQSRSGTWKAAKEGRIGMLV